MENFFTVIVIIAISVTVFISYYTGKNLFFRYRQKKMQWEIEKKRYEDEKKYLRNYIRTLLKDLENGKLNWILVFSRLDPETKLELIYNSVNNMIQIQHRIRHVNDIELNSLKKLGLKSFDTRNGLYSISVTQNSTIVTDVIYFLLENVGDQKHTRNIKVVTSGGQ
jgi:hypothetical protein